MSKDNLYSKKYYNKESGKWEPLYSVEGRSAYQTAKDNGYEGDELDFNRALSNITSLLKTAYYEHSTVTLDSCVDLFEAGTTVEVTLVPRVIFNGKEETPVSFMLKKGETVLSTMFNSYVDSISETTTYTAIAEVYPGVFKETSITIEAWSPLYIGPSIATSLDSNGVLALPKQELRKEVSGVVNFNTVNGQYIWVCVPTNMWFSRLLSCGVEVPMNLEGTISTSTSVQYNCYRSEKSLVTGIFNGVLE